MILGLDNETKNNKINWQWDHTLFKLPTIGPDHNINTVNGTNYLKYS